MTWRERRQLRRSLEHRVLAGERMDDIVDQADIDGLLAPDLRTFVDEQQWTFAKTMPEWRHEYIVREHVDERLFELLFVHIRSHGYAGRFYEKAITYYEEAGLVYWTMGAPLDETIIVNRCRSEDTYERRLAEGTLP